MAACSAGRSNGHRLGSRADYIRLPRNSWLSGGRRSGGNQRERYALRSASLVWSTARDDQAVAFVQREPGCALHIRPKPFAGSDRASTFGRTAYFIDCRSFENLKDVVAVLVRFEFRRYFRFLRVKHHRKFHALFWYQGEAARVRLRLPNVVFDLRRGYVLEFDSSGLRRAARRRSKQRCVGKHEAHRSSRRRGAQEAAAGWILNAAIGSLHSIGHTLLLETLNHQRPQFIKLELAKPHSTPSMTRT